MRQVFSKLLVGCLTNLSWNTPCYQGMDRKRRSGKYLPVQS